MAKLNSQQAKPRLMLIDDDTIVRQGIAAFLEDSGFHVQEESSGENALQSVNSSPLDLVICDFKMPGMDGLAVLKSLREIDDDIPVIIVSGVGEVRDVVEALRLGAADYLVKPLVELEVLTHSIRRALERKQLVRENKRYRQELELANKELRENVRVFERDHQAGRRLQSKLLPTTPFYAADLNVSYKIFPSLYLSGDFIDYGYLSDRYLSFYLVDVSGHGAAPAFVTVWLKQLVRHYYRKQTVFADEKNFEQDSVELLKLINRDVIKSQFGSHMTCFVGVIDTFTREMRYVVGGHLPMPLLVMDGEAHFLGGKGKPVGIFEDAEWEGEVIQLPKDKSFEILVFSDGVFEILPEKELIQKENCLQELLSRQSAGLEDISALLNIDVNSSVPDDIAILRIMGAAQI